MRILISIFLIEIKLFFCKKRNFTFHHFHHNTISSTIIKSVQISNHNDNWGRLLHPEIRIIFSITFSAKWKQWSRCFVMMGDQLFTFPVIEYKKIKSMFMTSIINGENWFALMNIYYFECKQIYFFAFDML